MKISSKDPEKKTKLYLGIWWWASTSKTCEEHPCKCSQHNQHNNSDLLPCLNIPRSPMQKMRKRVGLCGGTGMACYLPIGVGHLGSLNKAKVTFKIPDFKF